jgi:hypothetical protein
MSKPRGSVNLGYSTRLSLDCTGQFPLKDNGCQSSGEKPSFMLSFKILLELAPILFTCVITKGI